MSISARLREERIRVGLSQQALGEIGGVLKQAQLKYEKGDRFPDAAYLAAIAKAGIDIRYVLTNERDYEPVKKPTAEEQILLDGFRTLDANTKKRVLAFIFGAELPVIQQAQNHIKIGSQQGDVVSGNKIINN